VKPLEPCLLAQGFEPPEWLVSMEYENGRGAATHDPYGSLPIANLDRRLTPQFGFCAALA